MTESRVIVQNKELARKLHAWLVTQVGRAAYTETAYGLFNVTAKVPLAEFCCLLWKFEQEQQ